MPGPKRPMQESGGELFDAANFQKNRESANFEAKAKKYYPQILKLCLRICREDFNPEQEARDLAQEVFVRIIRTSEPYKRTNDAEFMSWVSRIAINAHVDQLRIKKRQSNARGGGMGNIENLSRADPAQDIEKGQILKQQTGELLSHLSEQDRRIFLLKEVQGYDVEEIARLTGLNINTVKIKLFRARRKMLKASGQTIKKKRTF